MSKTLMEQVEETAALVESILADNGFQVNEDVDTVEGFMSVIQDVLNENDLGEEAEDQLCYAYAMLESSLSASEELEEEEEDDAVKKLAPMAAGIAGVHDRAQARAADAAAAAKKNPNDKNAQQRAVVKDQIQKVMLQRKAAKQAAAAKPSVALNARPAQESVDAPVSYRITRTVAK